MCNNMGFLENLLSGDFGGHFFILSLYFMLLSPDGIDVLPVVEPLSFAVFTNFILKPLFYNLISISYQAAWFISNWTPFFLNFHRATQDENQDEDDDYRGQRFSRIFWERPSFCKSVV